MPDINEVWTRIVSGEGDVFRQIRGQEFTYEIAGQGARLSTTNQTLPKSVFAQALARLPLASTAEVQDLRGPSYLYAILRTIGFDKGTGKGLQVCPWRRRGSAASGNE